MEYRIGDRDPVTGLFDVIWPDGSSTRNGLKAFNAVRQTGDVVLVTRRSDGMLILDSAKAVESSPLPIVSSNPKDTPVGYLQGQIWNVEETPRKRAGLSVSASLSVFDPFLSFSSDEPLSQDIIVKFTATSDPILMGGVSGVTFRGSAILRPAVYELAIYEDPTGSPVLPGFLHSQPNYGLLKFLGNSAPNNAIEMSSVDIPVELNVRMRAGQSAQSFGLAIFQAGGARQIKFDILTSPEYTINIGNFTGDYTP